MEKLDIKPGTKFKVPYQKESKLEVSKKFKHKEVLNQTTSKQTLN
jgi:hypothetical protein